MLNFYRGIMSSWILARYVFETKLSYFFFFNEINNNFFLLLDITGVFFNLHEPSSVQFWKTFVFETIIFLI